MHKLNFILLVFIFLSASMLAMAPEKQDQAGQSQKLNSAELPKQDCSICLDEKNVKDFTILTCSHRFCQTCLMYIVDQAIQEKSSAKLKCPTRECAHVISQEDIKKITDNDQRRVDAISEVVTREWLVTQPNAKQCPTPDCSYAFINDEKNIRTTICPKCNTEYCSQCLINHPGTITCKQADDLRPSDKGTALWLEQNTKPCPKCNARIEKNGGCLFVTCQFCKHGCCWNCHGTHHVAVCNEPTARLKISMQLQSNANIPASQVNPVREERATVEERARIQAQEQARQTEIARAIRLKKFGAATAQGAIRQEAARLEAAQRFAAQQAREIAQMEAARVAAVERARVQAQEKAIQAAIAREEQERRTPNQPRAYIVSLNTIPLGRITNVVAEIRFSRPPSDAYYGAFLRTLDDMRRHALFNIIKSSSMSSADREIVIQGRMDAQALVDAANQDCIYRLFSRNWLD